jgi:hypothetical protein
MIVRKMFANNVVTNEAGCSLPGGTASRMGMMVCSDDESDDNELVDEIDDEPVQETKKILINIAQIREIVRCALIGKQNS